jgi:hypothetical protein
MLCPICCGANGQVIYTDDGVGFIYRCADPLCPPGGIKHCCDGICEQPIAQPKSLGLFLERTRAEKDCGDDDRR